MRRVLRFARRLAAVLCAVSLSTGGYAAFGEPAFDPAPRDDEGRFRNPGPPVVRAGASVTFPFFLRRIAGSFGTPEDLPARVSVSPSRVAENPSVTWIGHATLLVRMGGVTFLTDPIWAPTAGPSRFVGARRWVPPALPLEELPPIDFVVVSHNHYDHLDAGTLGRLAELNPGAVFLVPLANGDTLRDEGVERVRELDWGDEVRVKGAVVHCLPARHWSRRGAFDTNRSLWASWAVATGERRFYFAGDTAWWDHFARIGEAHGPFDLAAVPIGAYEPAEMMLPSHLDPESAVRAALALRARTMLGIHFGTFDLADEPAGEPPRRFLAAARDEGVDEEDAWILDIGETRPF